MSNHSVAETKNQLSELIDRAEKGEEIVITRHGRPVAKISAVAPERKPEPITQEAIDWLKTHLVAGKIPKEDAGASVSRMRDEDWPR